MKREPGMLVLICWLTRGSGYSGFAQVKAATTQGGDQEEKHSKSIFASCIRLLYNGFYLVPALYTQQVKPDGLPSQLVPR